MYCINVDNFQDWREQARELLKRKIPPDSIAWESDIQSSLLSAKTNENYLSLNITTPNPTIPRDFISLAKSVACFRDESRWPLLYSVAWRLVYEDRNLLDDELDPQVARLNAMRKSVGRDKHKMEAFVRFRSLKTKHKTKDSHSEKIPLSSTEKETPHEIFIAWFEPDHLILPLVTPFFVKRFHSMHWSILTPDGCVHWNREQVMLTDGVAKPPNINDELEDLWREYYASIFNPARLKLKAMQSEMPKKYWVNLPEAPLIAELTRSAGKRSESMIKQDGKESWVKTAKSRYVKNMQMQLRSFHGES